MNTILIKQLLGLQNLQVSESEQPKLREKEIEIESEKASPKMLFSPEEDNFEVVKKSERPTKKQDEIIRKIIARDKDKSDDDVAKLEEELLAVRPDEDEKFESLLSEINDHSKDHGKRFNWNDVNSEDLLNVHDSFTVDPDLSKELNIPSDCPPLDPDIALDSSHNAYNSRNSCQKYKSNLTSSENSRSQLKQTPNSINIKESPSTVTSGKKLNCTMPKTQAEYWTDSRKFILERNNSTIKVKGKVTNSTKMLHFM